MTWDEVKDGKYMLLALQTMPNWEPKYREQLEATYMKSVITEYTSAGYRVDRTPLAVVWNDDGRPVLVLKPW